MNAEATSFIFLHAESIQVALLVQVAHLACCLWLRQAVQDPGRAVMLSLHQRAMLYAHAEGALASKDVNYRPKPHFRTRPPGIKTIVTANLLLVWLVCTVQI